MSQYLSLGFFLLVVLAATAFGTSFEAGAWYQNLNKPGWTPPHWLYGPLSAVVYVLMACAAWRVWASAHGMRLGALTWWLLVLALNTLLPWLMFGLNRPGWAFFLSVAVLGLSVMCARAFFLISRPAGLLLVPFVLWAAFVACLDYAIWTMNQGGLGQLFNF